MEPASGMISQLFSEYADLFTEEENKVLRSSDLNAIKELLGKKLTQFPEEAAVVNILRPMLCDKLDGQSGEVLFYRLFSSPQQAKRNLFYAQSISSMRFASNHYVKREGLDSYQMVFTRAGHAVLEYQGKKYPQSSGDAFLIDCRLPHVMYAEDPEGWECDIIHFSGLQSDSFVSALS